MAGEKCPIVDRAIKAIDKASYAELLDFKDKSEYVTEYIKAKLRKFNAEDR